MSFDYEYLDHRECEFGVPSKNTPEQSANCAEDAVATCWWREDKSDRMLVCEEHLMVILKEENPDAEE